MENPFTPEQLKMLEEPLDQKRVKHRQGGGGMSLGYIAGYDAIATANRIFGAGNWGYDLVNVGLQNVIAENGEIIGGYYAATVRLTVKNCIPITEEGVNPIQEGRNPRAKIDAHDMARKGAVTDALKRALRCYGDQFGNSLYDNELVDGQPGTGKATTGTANQSQRQQTPTATTSRPQTQNQPAPVNRTPAPQTAPQQTTAPRPVPTPNFKPVTLSQNESPIKPPNQAPIATIATKPAFKVQDDDNFKFYAAKLRAAKTMEELNYASTLIKDNVFEGAILDALRGEKAEALKRINEQSQKAAGGQLSMMAGK